MLNNTLLTLSFRNISVSPGRDTNNNLVESQTTEVVSPISTNWGWWKRTSQNVADWITSNESHAVPESQNSQKKATSTTKTNIERLQSIPGIFPTKKGQNTIKLLPLI